MSRARTAILVLTVVAAACQTDAGTTSLPPLSTTTNTAATSTTAPPTSTTPPVTATTTTRPPAPRLSWSPPQSILSMGRDFLVGEGDVSTARVSVIASWGGQARLFTRVDITGRGRNVGGIVQTDAYTDTRVWTSPDGSNWSEAPALPLPGFFDEWANAATALDGGVVVVGASRRSGTDAHQVQGIWLFTGADTDGAVWVTGPDDDAWSQVSQPSLGGARDEEIRAVVALGSRLVAVGSARMVPEFGTVAIPEYDGLAWVSDDGVTWTAAADPGGVFSGPGIITAFDAAVSDGTRVWAIGTETRGATSLLAVWTTDDGERWERVEITGDRLTSTLGIAVAAAGLSPAGMVAVGNEFGASGRVPVIWFSADGTAWERIDVPTGLGGELVAVTVTAGGFVAVGHTREQSTYRPFIVASGDGRTWEEVTAEAFAVDDMARGVLTAVGVHGDRVIVAGVITYLDDLRDVLVWSGTVAPSEG